MISMFSLSHSFCGSVPARSVRRDWYLLCGRILFWSAISCGSELIVGAFVQEVQQTSFSDTRYIQDVSWMAISHVSMCDEMSMSETSPTVSGIEVVVGDIFLTVILRALKCE